MRRSASAPVTSEKIIHQQVCDYINLQYPDVIFTSDSSGMRLTMGLRVEAKKKRCKRYKIPDLIVLHPSGEYSGLVIEIKRSIADVLKKNGEYKKSEHIDEQVKSLERLQKLGYCAIFGYGFNNCKLIIDEYMKRNKNN